MGNFCCGGLKSEIIEETKEEVRIGCKQSVNHTRSEILRKDGVRHFYNEKLTPYSKTGEKWF